MTVYHSMGYGIWIFFRPFYSVSWNSILPALALEYTIAVFSSSPTSLLPTCDKQYMKGRCRVINIA